MKQICALMRRRGGQPALPLLRWCAALLAAVLALGAVSPSSAWAAIAQMSVTNHSTGLPGVPLYATRNITTICTPTPLGYNSTWPHSANDGVGGPAPFPDTCTITAAPIPPVANVAACGGRGATWTTTITPSTIVLKVANPNDPFDVQYVAVENTLKCNPPSHLMVHKTAVNPLGGSPPAVFAMHARCGATNYPNVNVAAGQTVLLADVIPNSICSVIEPGQPPILGIPGCPRGAMWVATSSPPSIGTPVSETVTINVTNTLTCIGLGGGK